MIFPLVIATVMAILYIILALYQQLSLQSSLHFLLRQEAGLRSETVYREESAKPYVLEDAFYQGRTILRAEEEQSYRRNRLFLHPVHTVEGGHSYIIAETELVRKVNFGADVLEVLP